MAYDLKKCKERNMAEESETGDEDNEDGKIIHILDKNCLKVISKV